MHYLNSFFQSFSSFISKLPRFDLFRKGSLSQQDLKVSNLANSHIQAISIQPKDSTNDILSPKAIMSEAEISAHSLLRSVDKKGLIKEFKDAIKNYPTQVNSSSERLDAMLKTIANFICGGLITGNKLDGFFSEANFEIWEWLLKSADTHVNEQEALTLAKIKEKIGKLKENALFLADLTNHPLNSQETTEKIYAAAMESAKRVQKLKPGESEVFSGGWTNVGGGGGHAQIYEIQRREDNLLDVLVYTSTGFQLTELFLAGSKTRLKPVIRYAKVPDNVLLFGERDKISPIFIQGLMEVEVLAQKDTTITAEENNILAVLDHLETYRVPVPIEDAGAVTGQRAGTCVPSVTKQFIRHHAGKASFHKQLMFHAKLKLLIAFYCASEKHLEEAEVPRRALVQAAGKLLRKSVKLKDQGLLSSELFEQARATSHDILNKIEDIELKIDAARKSEVFHSDWQKTSSETQREARSKLQNQGFPPLKLDNAATKMAYPNLSIALNMKDNCPQSLAQAIKMTLESCSLFKKKAKNKSDKYIDCKNIAMQVNHLIDQVPLPGTAEAESFWKQFSLPQLQEVQKSLFEVAVYYVDNPNPVKHDLLERRFATILPLQVLMHFLAVKIDAQLPTKSNENEHANLASYQIPSYVDALHLEGLQFFDRKQFTRLTQAAKYFEVHNQSAPIQRTLFASELETKSVLKEEIIDVKDNKLVNGYYWKALLDADPALKEAATQWVNKQWPDYTDTEIKSLYQRRKDDYKKEKADLERWKANPNSFFEKPEPIKPKPIINIPLPTKLTLLLDEVGRYEGDLLTYKGYGHITHFRVMNSLANRWMYENNYWHYLYVSAFTRHCTANRGDPNSGSLNELFGTNKNPSQLVEETFDREKLLDYTDKELLTKEPLCTRKVAAWKQATAEGTALEKGQNTSLQKFIRPLSQWEIAPGQLIYELEKEWNARVDVDLLDDSSMQEFFCRLFFRSPVFEDVSMELGFGSLIVQSEALRSALESFINKGFAKIQTAKMSFKSACFFFKLSFHAAKYLADAGLHTQAERFNQLALIKGYLNDKSKLSPDTEKILNLYKILFYSTKNDLTQDERASTFASWGALYHNAGSNLTSKGLYHIAFEFIMRLTDQTSRLSDQELGQLGDKIAAQVPALPTVEGAKWGVDPRLKFPFLSNGSSKINLLTGQMYRPEGLVAGSHQNLPWAESEDFQRLFKDNPPTRYEDLGGKIVSFTHPTKGSFRLVKRGYDSYSIQRRFGGNWYQYEPLHKEKNSPFPLPLIFDHAYWVPVEGANSELKGIFTDLNHFKPLYQAKEDGIIEEIETGHAIDFLSNNSGTLKGFENFADLKTILTVSKEDALQKVVFPSFTSLDGNPLAFECEGDQLVWRENREFKIPNKMKNGLLGTFKNYLYLKSNQGQSKLLVPIQSICQEGMPTSQCELAKIKFSAKTLQKGNELISTQRYLTFDCSNGVVKANTIEGRCFLAYIYLAQKKYEEASILLKGIQATEEISKTTTEILDMIQGLNLVEDNPNAKMVKFHALSICLKQVEKKILNPTDYFGARREQLRMHIHNAAETFQSSHSISANCRLPEKDEIRLMGLLYNEGTRMLPKEGSLGVELKQVEERWKYLKEKVAKPAMKALSDGARELELKISKNEPFDLSSQQKIDAAIKWLKDALDKPNSNEKEIYSTLSSPKLDGQFFLDVYHAAANCSPSSQEFSQYNLLLYRLLMWKKSSHYSLSPSSSIQLDVLLAILLKPNSFPSLVNLESSDEELLNFLKKINLTYRCMDGKVDLPKYSRYLEKHKPNIPTNYPISLKDTFEKPVQPLSSIAANKIPLEVNFDGQVDRWKQLQQWKSLLKNDASAKPKGQDFKFNSKGVLTEDQQSYEESLKRDFELFNQDYEKGKEQNLAILPKSLSAQSCTHIQQQAQSELEILKAKRNGLEAQLLSKVNQRNTVELARLAGKADAWITFQDCVDCLLSFDQRSYLLKNKSLTQKEINEITQLTLQVLDLKSYEAQLGRVIDLTKEIERASGRPEEVATYRSFCQLIDSELSNQYHFDGFSSEEQVVLRTFAGQAGMIPFKKQIDLIKKMLTPDPEYSSHFKDIVIQLIMGGGKTSVIATLMLLLAAKREGRLAFFIVPPALHKIVTTNLRESLHKAFGKELLSLDLEREEFTQYKLDQTLELLKQAESNQQPIIVSATTLQGMELQLLSEARHLKTLLLEREDASQKIPRDSNKVKEIDGQIKVHESKAFALNRILHITESKADSLIDEVDLILDSLQDLNYVDGEKVPIHSERSKLLLKVYKALMNKHLTVNTMDGNPSVDELIRLCDVQRPHMDPKEYCHHVVPVLARHLANSYKPFVRRLPQIYKEAFVRFASGVIPAALETCLRDRIELTDTYVKEKFPGHSLEELKQDLEFLRYLKNLGASLSQKERDLADLLSITKHFLTELTPATLSKEGSRNFGLDSKNPGKIIPYVGLDAPALTEFGYHWENVAYHYQWGAAFKPQKEAVLAIAAEWISTAKHFVMENGEKFEETPEYIGFFELFGVKLDEIHEDGKAEIAIENIFKDRQKCLDLQLELARLHVKYATERLTSNGLALCNLIASRLTMSGTPWNADGYDLRLARHIIHDAGTEGRILHTLAQRATPDKIIEVDRPRNIQEFLAQVYARYAAQGRPFHKVRGIIEAGGTFKGFGNNSTVAKGWLDFIVQKQKEEKNLIEKTVDPKIEAVLFFGADSSLYAWRRGATQPEKVGGTSLEALKAKGLDPSKYVVYIDEVHGTGTDIPQKADAVNLLTFDDMTTRKATQNIMRCRKFLSEQDVDFVINQEVRKSLYNEGKNVQDLFINAAKKQSITKTQAMVRYYVQQIHQVFRKHAVKMVRKLMDMYVMKDIKFAHCVESTEKFFVNYLQELPFQQHGRLFDEINTKEMLQDLLKHHHAQFKQAIIEQDWQWYPLKQVATEVEKDVQELSTWIKESKVLPAKWKDLFGALGLEQQDEQKVEVHVNTEINIKIEMEIENELKQYLKEKPPVILPEKMMTLVEFKSLLEAMKNPLSNKVTSLKDQLSKYDYKFDQKRFHYEDCFSEPIFGTDAYFHTCGTDAGSKRILPVFHPSQRPPKQILAIRQDGQISWLLLSEHEARDAAKHLEALYQSEEPPEAWLIQLDGSSFVKGPEPFPQEEGHNGLLQLNAFMGHISYLNAPSNRESFENWLEEDSELKVRFLKLRALQDDIQKQHFKRAQPIENVSMGKKDKITEGLAVHMSALRAKKEKDYKGLLLLEKPPAVKLASQNAVSKLKVTQVPLLGINPKAQDTVTQEALEELAKKKKLKNSHDIEAEAQLHTKKQFDALRPYQVPYLTAEQIGWLPKSKVRYIEDAEQIFQEAKDPSGNMERKYLLSQEQLDGLKKEQSHLIPFVNPAFYSQFDQGWQIAAIPVEQLFRLHSKQAMHLSQKQIEQLTPEIIGQIPELLKALNTEQLHWISPELLPLIPQECFWNLKSATRDAFGSKGYNQLPDKHWLWKGITPKAISYLSKDKLRNIAKENLCHLTPENQDAIESISKWELVYLNKEQLAKRKSSFITYFLGIMTLGVAACLVSCVAYLSFPLVVLINKEKAPQYHASLIINFKRLYHLFAEYIPAMFVA